jgi:hypothetical protein
LERQIAEEAAVLACEEASSGESWDKGANDAGHVDRPTGDVVNPILDEIKGGCDPGCSEVEPVPDRGQRSRHDGTAGNARESLNGAQQTQLVEAA